MSPKLIEVLDRKTVSIIILIMIPVISLIMHLRAFDKDLTSMHAWRQTQTQATIISFYEEDFNILNPRRDARGDGEGIFRMEFPLMQWIFAGFHKILGEDIIITRILSFLIGIFSVFGIYFMLRNIFSNRVIAILGAWAFNFSPSFYYYTVSPLPDNLSLCCAIWGIAWFFKWIRNKTNSNLIPTGIFLSVATLVKLPFVFYYIVPGIYIVFEIIRKKFTKKDLILTVIMLLSLIPPFIWYLAVISEWRHGYPGILLGITSHNQSVLELLDLLQHNLISNLPELLLNYGSLLFFLAGFVFFFTRKGYRKPTFPIFLAWSLALTAYYLFEMNMIGKSHDYYLFPFLPVLFILVAYGAYHLINQKNRIIVYIAFAALIILPLTCYLRINHRWDHDKAGLNRDLITYKEELRKLVPDTALCIAGNDESHFIFFYYIHKKGWNYYNDLTGEKLRDMINKGARYLYSDSRNYEEDSTINQYFKKEIFTKGSIRVYELTNNEQ